MIEPQKMRPKIHGSLGLKAILSHVVICQIANTQTKVQDLRIIATYAAITCPLGWTTNAAILATCPYIDPRCSRESCRSILQEDHN